MLSGNAMAITSLCKFALTVFGLHYYRRIEREFPAGCAQTKDRHADENSAQELTSSRDEAAEERDRCLSFVMTCRLFTISSGDAANLYCSYMAWGAAVRLGPSK